MTITSHVARYALLNAAAATADQALVAATTNKRIKVMGFVLTAAAAGTLFFESATTTPLSPAFNVAANGNLPAPHNPDGWFETAVGEALMVTTAGAGATFAVLVEYVVY